MNTDNIVMWATRLSIVDSVYSRTQTLLATLGIQKQPREESYVSLEAEPVSPKSWMYKKHTSVSHSSTESEIMSLDAGLRTDGLHALDLWDIVIEVLRSTNNNARKGRLAQGDLCGTGTSIKSRPKHQLK